MMTMEFNEQVEHWKPSEEACPSREQLHNLVFRPERCTADVNEKELNWFTRYDHHRDGLRHSIGLMTLFLY